jgi:hypothetical protein
VRWRAVGGALGAVVLTAAVVNLRGQVEPPVQAAPPSPEPAAVVDTPGLPVLDPPRPLRWRSYTPGRGALDGSVGVQYVLQSRTGAQFVEFTLQRRDTGERSPPYFVPQDEAPWSSLLHNGLLMVSHGVQRARLTMFDPTGPDVRELPPPDGYTFGAHVVGLGDEVLLPGHQLDPPRECVLAVTPRAGTSRVLWCGPPGHAPGWLYAGADEVVWPEFSDPPGACPRWWRVQPGGRPHEVPGQLALCGARELLNAGGGWQVTLHPERDAARPQLTATDGTRRLVLGTASTMVACGGHVYWTAPSVGDSPDVLYRWLPGADHREAVLRLESAGSRRGLTSPRCTEGVLSVGEVLGSGPRLVQLRALNRP